MYLSYLCSYVDKVDDIHILEQVIKEPKIQLLIRVIRLPSQPRKNMKYQTEKLEGQ